MRHPAAVREIMGECSTEAVGELRLPPSGGDAALQLYLNFVQVFNRMKKWHFYVKYYGCLFVFECSLARLFGSSMIKIIGDGL